MVASRRLPIQSVGIVKPQRRSRLLHPLNTTVKPGWRELLTPTANARSQKSPKMQTAHSVLNKRGSTPFVRETALNSTPKLKPP